MFRTRHLICLLFAILLVAPGSIAVAQECGAVVEGTAATDTDPCAPEPSPTEDAAAMEDVTTDAPTSDGSAAQASVQPAQTATPTPTPTPTPTSSPSPTASSSPTASPSPTSTASPDQGTATVTVVADRRVAQVGSTVTYQITVQNTGAAPTDVTLVDDIPSEVQFLSASGAPTPTVGSGTLTWSLPGLTPGAPMVLTWSGRIARAGDLDALNVVTVTGATPSRIETHTYLADVQGISLRRSSTEPDWGTHTERNVISVQAPTGPADRPSSAAPDASAAPSTALPATGVSLVEIFVLAVLLVLCGLLVTKRGRRFSAAAMMAVLLMTACTSENPAQGPRGQSETDAGEDEVLGTRVGNDDGAEEEGSEDQGEDDADDTGSEPDDGNQQPDEPDDGTTDDGTTDDAGTVAGDPDADAPTQPEIVREVVLVEVPNEPPAPIALGSEDGDNAMLLDWSAESRSIVAASSTRLFDRSKVDLLSSLLDGTGAIQARVTLTNLTDDERLLVQGNLVLNVSGDAQLRLTSPSISQVLDPGDEVSADFTFTLPTGSYGIDSAYISG